jgi:hypothetical protein
MTLLKWLGFMVGFEKRLFKLGKSKSAKLKETLAQAMKPSGDVTRTVAKVCQKACGDEFCSDRGGAIYRSSLFEAVQGKLFWDRTKFS